MDFSIKAFDTKNTLTSAKSGCVAVAVFENKKLSQAAKALDGAGEITAALKSGDISGKAGTTLLLRGQRSDVISEEDARALVQTLPRARFVDLKGAGHMIAGDANDAFAASVAALVATVAAIAALVPAASPTEQHGRRHAAHWRFGSMD